MKIRKERVRPLCRYNIKKLFWTRQGKASCEQRLRTGKRQIFPPPKICPFAHQKSKKDTKFSRDGRNLMSLIVCSLILYKCYNIVNKGFINGK